MPAWGPFAWCSTCPVTRACHTIRSGLLNKGLEGCSGRMKREEEYSFTFLIDFSFWGSDYIRQEGSKCVVARSNIRLSVAQNNKSLCLVLSPPITGCLGASLLTYGVRMMEYTHCCNCSLPCQREHNRTLGHFHWLLSVPGFSYSFHSQPMGPFPTAGIWDTTSYAPKAKE